MRALRRALAALGAAAALGACAGAPPAGGPAVDAPPPPPAREEAGPGDGAAPGRFERLAARFTDRAVKAERAGDLRAALEAWRVVAAARPGAAEPARRVADLEARTRREAEARYRAGLARLGEGAAEAARRELLLALLADPDHAGALEALRARLDPDVVSHTVAPGDTFAGIAQRHLGDAALGGVVARVNGLDPAAVPRPGTVLVVPSAPGAAPAAPLPVAEPATEPVAAPEPARETEPAAIGAETPPAAAPPPAPAPDPDEERLARAQALLDAQRFPEAAAAANRLLESPVAGRRARELATSAWFGSGDRALKEGRFDEAAASYRRADPSLRDVPGALAAVERRRRERADELYNEGVRLFIDQKLEGAIAAWERTLALNPEHPQAPKDLEKAHALQRRLQELR